jgi:hypothetical protein
MIRLAKSLSKEVKNPEPLQACAVFESSDTLAMSREVTSPVVAEEKGTERDGTQPQSMKRKTIMLADTTLRGLKEPGNTRSRLSKVSSTSSSSAKVPVKDKELERTNKAEIDVKPSNSEWENRKAVPLKGSRKPGLSEKPRKEGLRQNPTTINRFRPDDPSTHTLGIPSSSTLADRDEVEWGADIIVAAIPITTTETPAAIPVPPQTAVEPEGLSIVQDLSPLPTSPVFLWDEYPPVKTADASTTAVVPQVEHTLEESKRTNAREVIVADSEEIVTITAVTSPVEDNRTFGLDDLIPETAVTVTTVPQSDVVRERVSEKVITDSETHAKSEKVSSTIRKVQSQITNILSNTTSTALTSARPIFKGSTNTSESVASTLNKDRYLHQRTVRDTETLGPKEKAQSMVPLKRARPLTATEIDRGTQEDRMFRPSATQSKQPEARTKYLRTDDRSDRKYSEERFEKDMSPPQAASTSKGPWNPKNTRSGVYVAKQKDDFKSRNDSTGWAQRRSPPRSPSPRWSPPRQQHHKQVTKNIQREEYNRRDDDSAYSSNKGSFRRESRVQRRHGGDTSSMSDQSTRNASSSEVKDLRDTVENMKKYCEDLYKMVAGNIPKPPTISTTQEYSRHEEMDRPREGRRRRRSPSSNSSSDSDRGGRRDHHSYMAKVELYTDYDYKYIHGGIIVMLVLLSLICDLCITSWGGRALTRLLTTLILLGVIIMAVLPLSRKETSAVETLRRITN